LFIHVLIAAHDNAQGEHKARDNGPKAHRVADVYMGARRKVKRKKKKTPKGVRPNT